MIGLLGLGIHLLVLRAGLGLPGIEFAAAQAIAMMVAMTSNFFLNNLFIYRDQRLKGWRLWRGLVSFYVICAVGAVGNVGIAPTSSPPSRSGGSPASPAPSSDRYGPTPSRRLHLERTVRPGRLRTLRPMA